MITVTISPSGAYTVDNEGYQWSRNTTLHIYGFDSESQIPKACEIHFANSLMNKALVATPAIKKNADGEGLDVSVSVPDSLLQTDIPIYCYVCGYDDGEFTTRYRIAIPVRKRERPGDYTIKDGNEVYSFNELNAKLSYVETLATHVSELGDSVSETLKREKSLDERIDRLTSLLNEKTSGDVSPITNDTVFNITRS